MNLKFKTYSFAAISALLLASEIACTSSSDGQQQAATDLDVTMDEPAHGDDTSPITYANIVDKKTKAGETRLPAKAVTNWQAFFKASPTSKQRSLLEQKLSSWVDTDSASSLLQKAATEQSLGHLAAAEVSLRKALRIEPHNLEAQLNLASLYLRKKDLRTAFDLLTQVRDGIAASDEVGQSFIFRYRYILALAYIEREEYEKGHKVLSDLIGIDKTFTPAYSTLASSYLAQGKDQVAEFILRRGIDRGENPAPLYNLMGVIAQKNNQHQSARAWYDKALESAPTLVPALVNRASLNTRNFEYDAAAADLNQALLLDPLDADALVALGVVHKRQGNTPAARASFSKAIDVAPEHAHARFNLAVLMVDELKRPNEALRLFHEVLQTSTPGSEIRQLARSYINELKQTGEPY